MGKDHYGKKPFMTPLQWLAALAVMMLTAVLVQDKAITVAMELLLLRLLYAGHRRRGT